VEEDAQTSVLFTIRSVKINEHIFFFGVNPSSVRLRRITPQLFNFLRYLELNFQTSFSRSDAEVNKEKAHSYLFSIYKIMRCLAKILKFSIFQLSLLKEICDRKIIRLYFE